MADSMEPLKSKVRYSNQAKTLLENMPEFDKIGFEKWYAENLTVGSNNILEYLMNKKQERKNEATKEIADKTKRSLANGC